MNGTVSRGSPISRQEENVNKFVLLQLIKIQVKTTGPKRSRDKLNYQPFIRSRRRCSLEISQDSQNYSYFWVPYVEVDLSQEVFLKRRISVCIAKLTYAKKWKLEQKKNRYTHTLSLSLSLYEEQ